MKEFPHVRSLMISEYSAKIIELNNLFPIYFSLGLVERAHKLAAVSMIRKSKRPPLVLSIISSKGVLYPGGSKKAWTGSIRAFRYRAGDDRILFESSNNRYQYKEIHRGLAKLAIVSNWLPETLCVAIRGKTLNQVVEENNLLIHKFNPVIRGARNGYHRGKRAVILRFKMRFGTEFWD